MKDYSFLRATCWMVGISPSEWTPFWGECEGIEEMEGAEEAPSRPNLGLWLAAAGLLTLLLFTLLLYTAANLPG